MASSSLLRTRTFWAGVLTALGNLAPLFLEVTAEQLTGFNGVMLAVIGVFLRDGVRKGG
jgi:hypothetical protein